MTCIGVTKKKRIDMKKIVIVGATSGIGEHVAEALAATGWRVGVAGRKVERMKALKEMFPDAVEWEAIDITKSEAPRKLLDLIRKLGGIDIYFHVAGIGFFDPELDISREVATAETNVVGFTRMVDTAFHYFRNVGKGHIAIISSVAGTKGIGEIAAYSASKRYQQNYLEALEQLSRMRGLKIAFTDIRPGWVRTPLLDPAQKYPMIMKEEEVVPMIIKALNRRTRIAVIDRRWAVAVFFWRLIPGRLWVKLPIHLSRPADNEQEIEIAAQNAAD